MQLGYDADLFTEEAVFEWENLKKHGDDEGKEMLALVSLSACMCVELYV